MKRALFAGVAIACAAALAAACSSRPKVPPGKDFSARPKPSADPNAKDAGPPDDAPSHLVATLGKSDGPWLARGTGGALVAWIAQDGTPRRLFTVAIGNDGQPRGEPRAVANAAAETPTFVLRSAADKNGYYAGWAAILDRGELLSIVALASDGSARGPVVDVARTNDHIVWFDIVATTKGAIVVWAEETRAGDANMLALALDPDGKARGLPSRVANGVTGWQVVATPDGAGVALVSPVEKASAKNPKPSDKDKDRDRANERARAVRAGTLSWVRLGADARSLGAPTPIATKPTVTGDIAAIAMPGLYVFAWTDRSGVDPEVEIAAIDDNGKTEPPRHAMEAIGGGTLAGLAWGKQGALLAWDEPQKKPRDSRHVHLSRVTAPSLAAQEIGAVEVRGHGAPEIVATDAGYAMLFAGALCPTGKEEGERACASPLVAPAFMRFDAQLTTTEAQPIRVGSPRESASLAWALDCAGDRCMALAAAAGNPTPVSAIDLAPRASAYRAPLVPPRPANAPRVTGLETIAAGDTFADLSVAPMGDGSLVALVTSAVDDNEDDKGKKPAKGAAVSVRAYDANGIAAKGAPFVVTTRALTSGGVALATGDKLEDGAAVAWVARERASGDPQVFVTKLNAAGRRTNEVQLTAAKGDAADVALAWTGNGFLVAWVDSRDGNGEVYAAKLDKDLNRTSKEERITNAPGDAGDVTLLVQGDRAWLAWSDPRESPKDGFSDIYVTAIKTKDATRAQAETRVLATAAHSRSPALALVGDSPTLAWIEQAPLGIDAASMASYGAMIVRLDTSGVPRAQPMRAPIAGPGIATGIALESTARGARAFIARSARDEVVLDAFDASAFDASTRAWSLFAVDGPPSLEVPIGALGDWLYYHDEGAAPGERRVRRATVVWRR